MQLDWNENQAMLRGTVGADPVMSHENHGILYWRFPMVVVRLSGAEDRVNVVAPASLLEQCPIGAGAEVAVTGEVRSFNNKSGSGSRLVITLYARTLCLAIGEPQNTLVLAGVLCKPPTLRRTPLGRKFAI